MYTNDVDVGISPAGLLYSDSGGLQPPNPFQLTLINTDQILVRPASVEQTIDCVKILKSLGKGELKGLSGTKGFSITLHTQIGKACMFMPEEQGLNHDVPNSGLSRWKK